MARLMHPRVDSDEFARLIVGALSQGGSPSPITGGELLSALARCCRGPLQKAILDAATETLSERGGLTTPERTAKLAELDAAIAKAERDEEMLIRKLEAEGN